MDDNLCPFACLTDLCTASSDMYVFLRCIGYPGDGIVRSSSLYVRKAEPAAKSTGLGNARKKSLPDIRNVSGENIMSRETISLLSSQRREAIRRQEEEAQRLKANPLLYLLSPEVWVSTKSLLLTLRLKVYVWVFVWQNQFQGWYIILKFIL